MPKIHVSVGEFLNECDTDDCRKLVKDLAQDGYIDGYDTITGDLDVDTILDDLTTSQKNDMVEGLRDMGYIPEYVEPNMTTTLSISEETFEIALSKLHGKWNRLSSEEEEIILRIANRF